jgi:SAM-dependent methyltransferase
VSEGRTARASLKDRMRAALARSVLHPRWIGRVYMEPALQEASVFAGGVLLDVGCGRRPYEALFAGRVSRYVGVDWPRRADPSAPHVVADATRLPFRAVCADTVLATELMEHLASPDRFLEEVARVLRPSGTLILSVPFLEPLHEEPRDFYRFTPHGLRAVLARHGFALERLWAKGGFWSVTLGSFGSQALYGSVNPEDEQGRRRDNPLVLALALPVCTLLQLLGYGLDRLLRSHAYTLGYVALARRDPAAS